MIPHATPSHPSPRLTIARLLATSALVAVSSTPAAALPILQEVFYDADGSDAPDAFTEILGTPGMSLDGWSLVGINGGTGAPYRTIDLSGAIVPDDGLLVIATASAEPALAAARDVVRSVDWQNGPDAVQLIDPLAVVIDALQYGDAGAFNAGFGAPAPDAPSGSSLSRDMLGTNTGDNLADFLVGVPSPGIGPSLMMSPPDPTPDPTPEPTRTPVPEPTTMVLLGAGLAASLNRRRRACRRRR